MKVRFKASFASDLRPLKDKSLLERIKTLIANVEAAQTLSDLPNLKRLRGGGAYFRGRLGDYGVGIAVEAGDIQRPQPRKAQHHAWPLTSSHSLLNYNGT